MGLVVAGLVVLSFVADDGSDSAPDDATPSTVGTVATTTTRPGVLPPADLERGVCGLLTREEAEALVGHALAHEPVEPIDAQCSWPDEAGKVVGELYLVVKGREDVPLRDALAQDWGEERFRFEAGPALGDSAWYVVQLADAGQGTDEFVVGLSVHVGEFHVVIGNGARPSWEGTPEAVKVRLESAMRTVLARIGERFG